MAPRQTKYAPLPPNGEKEDHPIDDAASSTSNDTVDLEDASSLPASPPPRPSQRRNRKTTITILVLGLGWFLTALAAWHQSRASVSSSGFRMYTNTPIPQDVFKPVRKVFDKDERYMGGGREADAAWDALVAGECSSISFSRQYGFKLILMSRAQDMMPYGLRTRSNGGSERASSRRTTTPTRLCPSRRTSTSFRYCTSCIAWYVSKSTARGDTPHDPKCTTY